MLLGGCLQSTGGGGGGDVQVQKDTKLIFFGCLHFFQKDLTKLGKK